MGRKKKEPEADELDLALKKYFGYDSFRTGQKEVMQYVLKGKSCMVYAPVSHGKSILCQLPALLLDGITIVVSPLIALMKDQVDGMLEKGIPATFVNSSIPLKEQIRRISDCQMGVYKLLYVSPERFKSKDFRDACEMLKVSLLGIDESHCSMHDARVHLMDNKSLSFGELYEIQESGGRLPKARSLNRKDNGIEYKQITKVFRNPFQRLLKIGVSNGKRRVGFLEITPNHEIFTFNGVKPAGELLLGDCIESGYSYLKVESIEWSDRTSEFLYDIEVEDNHNYFVHLFKVSGAINESVLVHNCISQWGHDFRPDYQRLADARRLLGNPPILGLTATATPFCKADILKSLELPSTTKQFVLGFARPNLTIEASFLDPGSKYEKLLRIIRKHKKGIIYCSTIKTVEKLYPMLEAEFRGELKIGYYHGELPNKEKEAAQNAFITGAVDVIVSTTAMGMGIDRSDLRFVATFQVTASLADTYQMVGRAGRDEQPAWGYVMGSQEDIGIQEFSIDLACPPREMVEKIYEYMCRVKKTDESLDQISKKLNLWPTRTISAAMSLLRQKDFIDRVKVKGQRTSRTLLKDGIRPLNINWIEQKEKRYRMERNLKDSLSIFDKGVCPTKVILDYFEAQDSSSCGRCSACDGYF